MSIKEKLISDNIPKHVAIIMDGNGRWARQRGNDRTFGHEHGVESVRSAVEGARELGIKYLTLYAFSTENWNRPKEEVNALMALLVHAITEETDKLNENNVRLRVIGDVESLPGEVQKKLNGSIDRLADNEDLTLILALSYSSRWEMTDAMKKVAAKVEQGALKADEITEETFQAHLNTASYPDPELMIRTSGEQRISNFLLWQIAYAELYFTPTLWPDFRKENLFDAIYEFQQRERRFGKTSEQINEENAQKA
ncbi:isoprenyl transferase [Puteibacter caeruleilacunae]|nr:isoprenyl transferase [Puteibacter caeruleilacunae]